jgi:hypothetical protein
LSWNLNRHVSRVNEGHLSIAGSTDGSVSVLEAVHENAPMVETDVGVVVEAIFPSSDLSIVEEAERDA